MYWHAPLRLQSGVSRAIVGSYGERARFSPWNRRDVGGGPDGGEQAVSHLDAYIVRWFFGLRPETARFVGYDVEAL